MTSVSEFDSPSSVSEHMQELHNLVRSSAMMLTILCVFWSLFSGNLVSSWVQLISDQTVENELIMSIYAPFDWIQMRWSMVIMLSMVSLMPIISIKFYRFSRQGLYSSERYWLASVLGLSNAIIPLIILAVWTIGIPATFNLAKQFGYPETVSIRYDATALFSLAIGFSWILIVWSITLFSLTMTRVFGLMSDGKPRFRNRIMAISAGILILSLPMEYDGLRLIISLIVVYIADYLSSTVRKTLRYKQDSAHNDSPA